MIFNAQKPWSTLEPNGETLEEELFEHCQIHLVYIGKDQYATLHRKPFSVQNPPPSVKSMLDPMKIRKTGKLSCQQEPMDLSLHPTKSADTSFCDMDNTDNTLETSKNSEECGVSQMDLLGDNTDAEEPALPQIEAEKVEVSPEHAKYLNALENICKMWSEVKLLQMKSSDVEYYLNKVNAPKGDNTNLDMTISSVRLSQAGRSLRNLTDVTALYAEKTDTDSDYESDFLKSPTRKCNLFKPHASGPSASRVAAQNKRTGTPGTVLPSTMHVYARSDSPDYSENQTDDENISVSSSGSSQTFEPDLSEGESTDTFDRFDQKDIKTSSKKAKGSLNTVHYSLQQWKRIRTYRCAEKNCTYSEKSLQELNIHHIKNHGEVQCTGCEKLFKTPSSMKHHAYCHGDLPHVCDVYNAGFAFQSELNFHRTVYCTVHSYHCMAKRCGSSYKSSNELNKHAQKHLGVS